MRFRTESSPAPGELIKIQGFLNTWSEELEIEDFETPTSTEAWLRSSGLWNGAKTLTRTQHQDVVNFRSAIRTWIQTREVPQVVKELASSLVFGIDLSDEDSFGFVPTGSAINRVFGRLLIIVLNSMDDGTWGRLKCCQLPSCGWSYYDSTRSRTRRWCSMQTCGSRSKSRAYYKRTTKLKPADVVEI